MDGWLSLTVRNVARSPLRGALTVTAVAVSLVAFLLIRSVSAGWTNRVQQTPDNRVVTRNRSGWPERLPVRFVRNIRSFHGVQRATGAAFGTLRLPSDREVGFRSMAVDAEPFIAIHHELIGSEDAQRAFVADRRGAYVSASLAAEQGWSVGDTIHFLHPKILPTIELVVAGIFHSTRIGFGERDLFFHWEYFNELLPEIDHDYVNFIVAEIADPKQGARMAKELDVTLAREGAQSLTQEDQALNAQIVGEYGAILDALDVIAYSILGIVLLVLINTLAMGVRERSKEYGALRALGFRRKHLISMVVGEAALLGFAGGVLGLALAFPLVERAASAYLERAIGLDPLHISLTSGAVALCIGVGLGAAAGLLPGLGLTQQRIVDALRSAA